MLKSDPSLNGVFSNIEKQIASVSNKSNGNVARRDTTSNEIIYIPVVIHLLYHNAGENISDVQVKSQMDALNNDFSMSNSDRINTPKAFKPLAADARIRFCLAQVDVQGKRTTGIERKYTTRTSFTTDDGMKMAQKDGIAAWDSKRYLNIWVCNLSSRCVGYRL